MAGRGEISSRVPAAAVALALAALAAAPRPADAGTCRDDRYGFSVACPDEWRALPADPATTNVVASWQSDRVYEDPRSWGQLRPRLDVVVLPLPPADSNARPVLGLPARYKDLRDYLERTVRADPSKETSSFSKQEEFKASTRSVVAYEVLVERGESPPKKVFAWAVHADDAIYGLVGDTLVRHEDRLRGIYEQAFRTFKLLPRTAAAPAPAAPEPVPGAPGAAGGEAARRARETAFAQYAERLKSSLPDGWKVRDTAHFVVATHCDEKLTKEVVDHAEALRAWLDDGFSFLGEGLPGRFVLRICADRAEFEAIGTPPRDMEIVTRRDETGLDSTLRDVSEGVWDRWIRARSPEFPERAPRWVARGLERCVSQAVSRRGRLDLRADVSDGAGFTILRSKGALATPRDIVTLAEKDLSAYERSDLQVTAFVRYLLVGGAKRVPAYKDLLVSYLAHTAEFLAAEGRGGPPADRERKMLDTLRDKTFAAWSYADWDALAKAWHKDL